MKVINTKNKIVVQREVYKKLKKQSEIFEKLLNSIPETTFPIEIYSKKRIEEFLKEDIKR